MQKPPKKQFRHRAKFSQLILLNKQALIVSSCDSIFDTGSLREIPITDWFPFMESIYTNIWQIIASQPNISFNKVETPIAKLPGVYDFTFSKVTLEEEELLLWRIYDYTDLYEDFRQFQQRRNELEIHRETLERRHKAITHKEDIIIQQNIIIERLDHLQLTYFNKIKSALLAPVNVLDGLTFLLTKALKDKKYTQQLRGALQQLDLVLNELEVATVNENHDFTHQAFSLESLCQDIEHLLVKKKDHDLLTFYIEKNIPELLKGNFLYLKQTLFGILSSAMQLHPQSRFEINITPKYQVEATLSLQFQIIEFLHETTIVLTEEDYTLLVYRLSIIKQLLDLQKSTIQVSRDPKHLGIIIDFNVEFQI